jgi:carboxypeptidase Q
LKRKHLYTALLCAALAVSPFILPTAAKEPDKKSTAAAAAPATNNNDVDLATISRIRAEAFHDSKIMETMSSITDGIGPRLTNSPNMRKANAWTRDQLTKFGLENAHLEKWGPFGNGWAYQKCEVRMTAPDFQQFIALPKAWTPGTNGPVAGKLRRVKLENQADLDANKGKLAGAILLIGEMRDVLPSDKPKMSRYTAEQLQDLGQYEVPRPRTPPPGPVMTPEQRRERLQFLRGLNKYLEDEKVAATIEPTRLPGVDGTIFVQSGGSYREGESVGVPAVVMDIEHYGRLSRLLDEKQDVEVEVNVEAKFYKDDPYGYNTVAEIPGTDLKGQIVMLGGHLDSWHGGTGATDNGAGSGVAMEAVRIIKALDLHPRRTIRILLWSGEEEGLLGSRGYVAEHLASRPDSPNGMPNPNQQFGGGGRAPAGPLTLKPEWDKVSVYFNLDNGSGKIRGIYLQENAMSQPIFEKWMQPFKDLGMDTITMRNTGGTDHLSFVGVGVPGFQFIQDPLEYDTLTHHSNMDVYERLQKDDLMQASAIMASFVYQAAMRDEMFPRVPLSKTDQPPAANATPATADTGKGKPTPDKGKKK